MVPIKRGRPPKQTTKLTLIKKMRWSEKDWGVIEYLAKGSEQSTIAVVREAIDLGVEILKRKLRAKEKREINLKTAREAELEKKEKELLKAQLKKSKYRLDRHD